MQEPGNTNWLLKLSKYLKKKGFFLNLKYSLQIQLNERPLTPPIPGDGH